MLNDKVILRKVRSKMSADGYTEIVGQEDTEIWANKKSVTRSEFYAANAAGIEATAVFEIYAHEYSGQEMLLHEGKQYAIIRTYQKNAVMLELTCSDKAVGNG